MCSPATCQGAAGAGCFPRADETGGKGNNEGSPGRDFSAPQYLNKRSRQSPTTATRVNERSRQACGYKVRPRTSQANVPPRHKGRYTMHERLVRAIRACWHTRGPDVTICPDSLDTCFFVSSMRCKIVCMSVVRRTPVHTLPLRAYPGTGDVGRAERSRPLLPVACSAETVSRVTSRLS